MKQSEFNKMPLRPSRLCCGKFTFDSKAAAKRYLKGSPRMLSANRVYECKFGFFHLTSMPQSRSY